MSASCRDLIGKVGLVSVRVRRRRLNVGTFSSKSGECRYVFGEVGLYLGLVRQGRVSVGKCSARTT